MTEESTLDLKGLVGVIVDTDRQLTAQAFKAVNVSLTLRNWLIGAHIAQYELRGLDRAAYGDRLLSELAERLTSNSVSNCNRRQLYRYLRFFRVYPQIVGTVSPQLASLVPADLASGEKVGTASPPKSLSASELLHRLSYSHFELLVDLTDDPKRMFYEIECVHGGWSVRELKRQIGSMYYERSALSKDKVKLAESARNEAERYDPSLAIRDPYVFEFLGLAAKEVMRESDLEDALLDRLQDFLLELGRGFCFEARQKRILIGDTHGFIDLVFYHRILKCHVLVELKGEPFSHENVGQLNTYVSWFRENMMSEGDNPPIGLLLCTDEDRALAHYALAGMDNQLFVRRYKLALPQKEEVEAFIEQQVRKMRATATLPPTQAHGMFRVDAEATKEDGP